MLRSLTLLRLACSRDHHIREPLLTYRLRPYAQRPPRQFTPLGMTLTRAFEKLRDAGVIVPLAPRPLPHPIPPHFRSHEHCLYHQIPGHDTERCSALHHAIQDLIDSGVVDLARPSVTTNPLPAHSTHAVPPPPGRGDCQRTLMIIARARWELSRDFGGVDMTCWMDAVFSIDHVDLKARCLSIHTSYLFVRSDHSFIITFRVRTPRSGTHDVFYASHLMHEGSCRMTLHWGIATSESTFIGDTVTLLDTLHCDTLYSLMHDLLQQLSTRIHYFTLGHSRDGEHFSLEHSHPIWIIYTGTCPSFGERSDWFLTLEHLTSDMEIIGLFHVVLIAHCGIAT
ncbi:hypothetical protein CK203_069537 [Vitis vinifera]|uniref:Uncharacterized protein n=1 Tax=Vitis vinifera TaxID=29760 RepID=A0A438EKK9_VITVI|nr:hypothetical protein CK203_069537 [Vitis vinifera]